MEWIFFTKLSTIVILLLLLSESCTDQNTDSRDLTNAKTTANEWRVIGPGGGGGVLKPTISPFDENLVLVHCDMTAAYITRNGGESWKMKNLWNVPDDFEFDPVDSNVIYIATRGFRYGEDRGSGLSLLLRSDDRGDKWRIIFPDVAGAKTTERLQNTDLLASEIIEGALDGTIQKVEVDPADNHRIYLGLAPLASYISAGKSSDDSNTCSLALSTDNGLSWKTISKLLGKSIKAIIPGSNYGRPGEATVFTERGCYHVNENTGEIKKLALPVERLIAVEGGKFRDSYLIYIQSEFKQAGREGGIYLSNDMGETWKLINNGLLKNIRPGMVPSFSEGLAVCETKPEVAYISLAKPSVDDNGSKVEIYCIFKTSNAGERWDPVFLSSTPGGYITKNIKGSWMEQSYDPGWGGSPIDLGVAPGNPDICYAGDNGRGYKTTDGGQSWEQVYSHNLPDGSFSSSGLDVTTCYGVHLDPFDKNHFFICYTDIGLFHTFNGGKSWIHSIQGIPRDWQNTCYQVEFDPELKGRVWSSWALAHDLPREKMFGDEGFDDYAGGVAVSVDSGRTWQKSNTGLPENSICTNILLDPASPADSRTIYTTVFDKGIFKSTDGGKNWKKANNGFGHNLFAWQIRQNSQGRLFVLFARGKHHGKTIDGAIYSSNDKAGTWEQLLLPDGVNGPHDLLIDPVNSKIMYVSCWPSTVNGNDVKGGVLKTMDGGLSWRQVFDERVRVNSAGMDPQNPNVLFINTFQNAAYRSDNSGESWNRIEGYRFKWGQRAIPDINNPGMLFLTTYGGSVFYGPAEGVHGALDDIVNMPEGWW